MREVVGNLAFLALIFLWVAAAHGATPHDGFQLVGAWGASEKCHDGAYAFEASGHGLAKVVRYNGKTQSSPISVKVAGDIVQVTDEETLYTYRILGPNKLLFVGFTKLSNGLTADVKPYAWHRCG
jgi:hypothetical protein